MPSLHGIEPVVPHHEGGTIPEVHSASPAAAAGDDIDIAPAGAGAGPVSGGILGRLFHLGPAPSQPPGHIPGIPSSRGAASVGTYPGAASAPYRGFVRAAARRASLAAISNLSEAIHSGPEILVVLNAIGQRDVILQREAGAADHRAVNVDAHGQRVRPGAGEGP